MSNMIDYYTVMEDTLPMSIRVLHKKLQERGWQAYKLASDDLNNLILVRPDGKELRIASSTPPTTSVFALRLADSKLASYNLLQQIDIPQPETIVLHSSEDAKQLLEKYSTIIIKPVDGAHGRGVTTEITQPNQIEPAIQKAVMASPTAKFAIAQPQLPADALELRVICINYKFIEAIARIPAHVTGDGKHSLIELIDLENTTLRTAPYKSDLSYIDRSMALNFLGERQNEIPAAGEKVRVVASCNLGQGGTAEDYSASVPDEMKAMAEKIALAAQLPVIGIDFYGDQVIEFNACPSLYYPTGDAASTKAIDAYIDYLAEL